MEINSENTKKFSNYELLEKEYIKNKINEINENIKQIKTHIQWIIGICGASFAFIISKYDNILINNLIVQFIFICYVCFFITYLFLLELKYQSFCNIKQDFYNAINDTDYTKINNILFTATENYIKFTRFTFPMKTFLCLLVISITIILLKDVIWLKEELPSQINAILNIIKIICIVLPTILFVWFIYYSKIKKDMQ